MAFVFSNHYVKHSVRNENIAEEIAQLPFADFVSSGQKRLWSEFTLEEKKELARKYPARPDLPHPLRVITAITTTHDMNQPESYYRGLKATGGYVNAFVHAIEEPRGFTTAHALMTNVNKRRGGFYAFLIMPVSFVLFCSMIGYKQYEQGFWFGQKSRA